MSEQEKQNENPKIDLEDKELIKQFFEFQKQQANNESKEIDLQKHQLELNSKLALRTLDIQEKILVKQDQEDRKKIKTWSLAIIGFLLVILIFLFGCLYIGHKDFALGFLQIFGYILTTAIGYYFGKQTAKKESSSEEIEEAEIIEG